MKNEWIEKYEAREKRIKELETEKSELIEAAQGLLNRIDTITTDSFSNGGEKTEREHLRNIIAMVEGGT